ncbi:MAG TPA: hypothetical protein VLB68_14655 [Pyrinomonadaceae bacterium]|nr:hypothetical protein [Pyrinomonadaceae bacterium]
MMRAKAVWMDVDHAEETIQTIGTGDTTIEIVTVIVSTITTAADITETATMTATTTAATGTATAGIAAAVSHLDNITPNQ